MSIIGIVAIARNFAIGKGGQLPWHYSADLKFFKQKTTGNIVVMGYNTWQSIGRPLPNRQNVVVSRSRDIDGFPDVKVVRGPDEALVGAKEGSDIYIIGGAEIYKLFADRIDRWIVTEVPVEVDAADAFMPQDFLSGFHVIEEIELDEGLKVKVYTRTI